MTSISLGAVLIVAIVVLGVPVMLALLLVMLARMLRGPRSRDRLARDEVRLIQETHQALSKLESRLESLETILLDGGRGKEAQE